MRKISRILGIIGAIALIIVTILLAVNGFISYSKVSNGFYSDYDYYSYMSSIKKMGIDIDTAKSASMSFYVPVFISLFGIVIASIIALFSRLPDKGKTFCRVTGIFGLAISIGAIVVATIISNSLSNTHGYSADYVIERSPYFIMSPSYLYAPAIILLIVSFIMVFIRKIIDNNKTKGIIGAILFAVYVIALFSIAINIPNHAVRSAASFRTTISIIGSVALLFLFNFRFYSLNGETVMEEKKYKPKKPSATASTPKTTSNSNTSNKNGNRRILYEENGMYFSDRE